MKQFINNDDFGEEIKKLDENGQSMSRKQYDELVQKYKRLLYSDKAMEKVSKVDVDSHEAKKNDISFDNTNILNKIKEKEKELDLISQKYDQLKKLVKSNQLVPLEQNSQNKQHHPSNIPETEKIMQRHCLEFKKRETKRDAAGGVFTEDVACFDDCYQLDSSTSHRIK